MTFQRVIPTLICVAVLSACASGGQGSGSGKAAPTLAAAMSEADAAVMAGQTDKAYGILKSASSTFPTEKTPWQRMAQMRFDSGNYGEAIVNALEALERDPDDTLANSIAAVAGLRVTSKSLGELSDKNNLASNVRVEAQELAKLLRDTLGEKELVPPKEPHRPARLKEPSKRPTTASAAPARPAAPSSNPLDILK